MNRTLRWLPLVMLSLLALNACGDDDPPLPVRVQAGSAQRASACQTLRISGTVTGDARRIWWDSPQDSLLYVSTSGSDAELRAPAVVVPTTLHLRLNAEDRTGMVHSSSTEITVDPLPSPASLAPGMAWDCAPFLHGVASGEPRENSVTLWTRITPDPGRTSPRVAWEVASEPRFADIVAHGARQVGMDSDFTLSVNVGGLQAARTYYYRFVSEEGVASAVGRTRTAPSGAVERLRFAVASCSSVYSGYFNAYRRIAERTELDLVIHLGDYIYDFVDEQEQIRVPSPYPTEPETLQQWRERHAFYLADPDLRRARAMHPWMMIWDNHDVDAGSPPSYGGGTQAFREWNAMGASDGGPNRIYRSAPFGDLVDLFLLDALLHRNIEKVPGTDDPSILGNEQFEWLRDGLRASRATWRLLGNQRLLGTVRINPTYAAFIGGERREVFDPGAWDGFAADRSRLLSLLTAEGIKDNLVLSGDSHVSIVLDLVDHPQTPGALSAGVEFLPTSISRGNFDETLTGFGFPPAQQATTLNAILNDTRRRNPHHVYVELTKHGYGTLDITHDRIVAGFWYSPVLQRSDEEEAGPSFTVERGANRWTR